MEKVEIYNNFTDLMYNDDNIINNFNEYKNKHLFYRLVYCPDCDETNENIIYKDHTINIKCKSCKIKKDSQIKNKIINLIINDLTKFTANEILKYFPVEKIDIEHHKRKYDDEKLEYCLKHEYNILIHTCWKCKKIYCGFCVNSYDHDIRRTICKSCFNL